MYIFAFAKNPFSTEVKIFDQERITMLKCCELSNPFPKNWQLVYFGQISLTRPYQ